MNYAYILFSRLVEFLAQIFNATNTTNLFLAAFSIAVVYRFLIKPILGGRSIGGSDRVKKSKNRGDKDE